METKMQDRYINYFRYSAGLKEDLLSFWVKYDGKGQVLQNCQYYWRSDDGNRIYPSDFKIRETQWKAPSTMWYCTLVISLKDGPAAMPEASVTFKAMRDHISVEH